MTDDEIEKLASKLVTKLEASVTDNIYRDAGRNLFTMVRNAFWGLVIAVAAWGATKVGNGQ